MIPFQKIVKTPIKDAKGFTLVELMLVISILAILSAIAILNYIPMRAKSMDSVAHADARHIMGSVVNAITSSADIDFAKGTIIPPVGVPGAVGGLDLGGNPRSAIFNLSLNVHARIIGNSNYLGLNNTYFEAWIYHTGGTTTGDPSGKKEYYCLIDVVGGVTTAPLY
jgi:prepilin-type N-terminal cleavage/methylation domain-containing protein